MNKLVGNIKRNEYWAIAFLFIFVKLCLHFFTSTNYELHRDEMLYFNMADHLAWGYASVPPLIGFLAFLTKTIFGYSVFGIRFLPAFLGAMSMYIMAKIILKLNGGVVALVIALSSFLLSTGFLLFDSIFTPNVIEQFLWLLITWCLFKMTLEYQPKLWIWIGILVGLAFLTKYSIVFLLAGLVPALLLSPHRRLFNSRYFIVAIIISSLMILPHIFWQYTHNWPVIFHMEELKRTQLNQLNYLNFVTDVISLNLLTTVVWLIGLFVLLFVRNEKNHQYLAIGYVITFFLFLLSNGKGYYIMGIIPFLFAFGGFAMEKYLLVKFKYSCYCFLVASMVVSVISLPYVLPVLSFEQLSRYREETNNPIIYPFYRWEDGKNHPISQIYADMTGWEELTSYVARAYFQLSKEDQKRCTVFGEKNYGYAGAIHFYGKRVGLPEAITFLDSYVIWAPETIPEGPIIYMSYDAGELINLYDSVVEVGCINNPWFREKGLKVFLCTQAKTNVAEVYTQLVSKAKLIYRR